MALVFSSGHNPKPIIIESGHEFEDRDESQAKGAQQSSIKGMKLSNEQGDLENFQRDYEFTEYQPRRIAYGTKDIEV